MSYPADWLAANDGSGSPLSAQVLGAMRLLGIQDTTRSKVLSAYTAFCENTQHDHHAQDWDGVPRDPGVGYMLERLKPQGFVPVNSVPGVGNRKPNCSIPLATQVVSRFTELLLGQGRRPGLHVDADQDTQAYLECLFQTAALWDTLAQARDVAGACGSSLIACSLVTGQPTAEVLHPADCWVPEWDQTVPGWRPLVVVEQRRVETTRLGEKGLEEVTLWRTRAWTTTEVITWPDVDESEIKGGAEWPEPTRIPHGLGICPVVWLQNTRSTASPDGRPDCDGCWQLLDQIDRLESRIYKAVSANASPQLIIREEERLRRRNPVVQRGPTSVISLTPQGNASYLEMSGDGIRVAQGEISALVDQVLQTCECVVVRPEHAKAYQSGEALQILWRAMESRANRLRTQLEGAIRDLCRIWITWGKKAGVGNLEDWDWVGPPSGIMLPPRRVEVPVEPPEPPEPGMPPGPPEPPEEPQVTWEAHVVGDGSWARCDWPPYWQPTPLQIKSMAEGLAKANGGKPMISTGTAIRVFAAYTGQEPQAEIVEIERERAEGEAKMAALMGTGLDDQGGDDDGEDQEAGADGDAPGGEGPPEDDGEG